jgi:diadenosine tetraphosphate (Ap4A) HIT family hydrolase
MFTIFQSHRRLAPQMPLPEATSCIAQVHTLQALPARTTIYRRCFKLRRMSNPVVSPFLGLPSAERPCADEVAFAIFDCHPVSPEHGAVIAKLVVPRFFGCSRKRQGWHVRKEKRLLDGWLNRKPDGYNVDFDSGSAAGRNPPHVNAIPRYSDNVPDPHRGLRRMILPKRSYLVQPSAAGERTPLMSLATFLGGRGCRSGRQRQTGSICLSRLCNVQGPNRQLFRALALGARNRLGVSGTLSIMPPSALRLSRLSRPLAAVDAHGTRRIAERPRDAAGNGKAMKTHRMDNMFAPALSAMSRNAPVLR